MMDNDGVGRKVNRLAFAARNTFRYFKVPQGTIKYFKVLYEVLLTTPPKLESIDVQVIRHLFIPGPLHNPFQTSGFKA